jgi:hypothetical protein
MTPFDPWATHIRWYQIWRSFVKTLHLFPLNKVVAKQACTAQAFYVMYEAIDKVENYHA